MRMNNGNLLLGSSFVGGWTELLGDVPVGETVAAVDAIFLIAPGLNLPADFADDFR
jgi:hypothetical protein